MPRITDEEIRCLLTPEEGVIAVDVIQYARDLRDARAECKRLREALDSIVRKSDADYTFNTDRAVLEEIKTLLDELSYDACCCGFGAGDACTSCDAARLLGMFVVRPASIDVSAIVPPELEEPNDQD